MHAQRSARLSTDPTPSVFIYKYLRDGRLHAFDSRIPPFESVVAFEFVQRFSTPCTTYLLLIVSLFHFRKCSRTIERDVRGRRPEQNKSLYSTFAKRTMHTKSQMNDECKRMPGEVIHSMSVSTLRVAFIYFLCFGKIQKPTATAVQSFSPMMRKKVNTLTGSRASDGRHERSKTNAYYLK